MYDFYSGPKPDAEIIADAIGGLGHKNHKEEKLAEPAGYGRTSSGHYNHKFCRDCGRATVAVWTGKFHPDTGEKIMHFHCPSLICQDGGNHDYSFWSGVCKKCGKSESK